MKHSVIWSALQLVAFACTLQNAVEQERNQQRDPVAADQRQQQAARSDDDEEDEQDDNRPDKQRQRRGDAQKRVRNHDQETRRGARFAKELVSEVSEKEEQAIKALVQQMQQAFNDHNAESFGELFTKDAEIVNVDHVRIHGRGAIQDVFADYFERNPEVQLEIEMHALRPLTDSLLLEQGVSRVFHEEQDAPEDAYYTVIYTREDDEWRMAYARDSARQKGPESRLQQLSWLIGDWIDESADGAVVTSYRWGDNQRFIEGEYYVDAAGYPSLSGTLRIGWDPQVQQLRSWVFDSQGGFASGYWSQDDDGWIIKLKGVMSDGSEMSATNYLKRLAKHQMSYQSVDRTIAGEKMPDGEKLVIVRHPPKPASVGKSE